MKTIENINDKFNSLREMLLQRITIYKTQLI